jgi:hypothetical protein
MIDEESLKGICVEDEEEPGITLVECCKSERE